ncbi:regulator of nonsense transcripts 3A isoform X2 [Phymastichus coffea]|uniref:regulator of nonsense transcripts 3A isoform X2 n=1 Tax=Phymastichus coffea TaxID=108790 RepID=UPI00273C4747|nr:regulator of nonsense transcripts 3A isoform X2 [Phymastichus coffea]
MTEETQQASETQIITQQTDQCVVNVTTEVVKAKDGKKEKCRPMTKVVIRRLPPTMTQDQFFEQVSPLSEYDYLYFAKADMSLGQYAYSRAYIDFVDSQDVFAFREKFDNYVFVDSKGTEFPAVVEYAPFQRVPKKRIGKKKDIKCGTIESDPYYINFLESIKHQETEAGNTQPKTEYSFQLNDHATKKVTSTPLLDFLKQKKQEKQRIRDEKREEKRRRDLERKRSKDEPMISKVLKNIEDKDRDSNRDLNKENKDDKERVIIKDFKNKNKKEDRYRDKMGREVKVPMKNYRDRDDRMKDREVKQTRKYEDKRYNKKDDRDSHSKDDQPHEKDEISYKERKIEEKRGKSYEKMRQEKKRLVETLKKQNDESQDNLDNEADKNEDSCRTCLTEKNDSDSKNKQKIQKISSDTTEKFSEMSNITKEDKDSTNDKLEEVYEQLSQVNIEEKSTKLNKSNGTKLIVKRRSSLESGGGTGSGSKSTENNESNNVSGSDSLRRHKSLDGGDDNNLQKNESDEKDKDKKDPRVERRIRNKDRPAMEIYRPGMGKFSKKRMEQEKGSDERVTPSQSPTPSSSNSNSYKSVKNSGSEVRTMTFKRSVSREVS